MSQGTWIKLGLLLGWALLVSGFFSHTLGPPGVRQAVQLRWFLQEKKTRLAEIEARVEAVENHIQVLRNDPKAQEAEIRAVLGFIRPNELVFDVSALSSPPSGVKIKSQF